MGESTLLKRYGTEFRVTGPADPFHFQRKIVGLVVPVEISRYRTTVLAFIGFNQIAEVDR
jgi:hypothetical protein